MSTRRDRAAGAIAQGIWPHQCLDDAARVEAYRIADMVLTEVDRVPDISEMIEASSLGTPGAKALRASVADDQVQRAIDRANELRAQWPDGTPMCECYENPGDNTHCRVHPPQTDDGAVRSPATPGAVPHPAAQAGVTGWRPAPSSPLPDGEAASPPAGPHPAAERATAKAASPSVLPRPFLLFRIRDVSGTSGTGVVAWGTQFPDGAAALRWNGQHPSTAAWPSVNDIVAVHGHQGATELVWLTEEMTDRVCRACGCTDETACAGGCYWVAEDLCSQCGDGPGVPS